MLFVLSSSFSPFFNLAAEEHLLKNKSEDVFMLWRAESSVIIGKHQNALAEINYKYVIDNKINIARRISGGGTVVHDSQNLNFTFIANGEEGKLIDFKRFVSPVTEYLKTLGIPAEIGEKNDIRIGDLKISGNAEHVYRKRVLHHGTLLYNSNLEQLRNAIKVKQGIYFDKAVQSNRASVTNIVEHLQEAMPIENFIHGLSEYFKSKYFEVNEYKLDENDIKAIEELVNSKYKTTEWVFGYSPKYSIRKDFIWNIQKWEFELYIEKGVIYKAIISIDNKENVEFMTKIKGLRHHFTDIFTILKQRFPNFNKKDIEELTYMFF